MNFHNTKSLCKFLSYFSELNLISALQLLACLRNLQTYHREEAFDVAANPQSAVIVITPWNCAGVLREEAKARSRDGKGSQKRKRERRSGRKGGGQTCRICREGRSLLARVRSPCYEASFAGGYVGRSRSGIIFFGSVPAIPLGPRACKRFAASLHRPGEFPRSK